MPLPPRRGSEIASCFSGVAGLDFLFCAGCGANQSKSSEEPVLTGSRVSLLRFFDR